MNLIDFHVTEIISEEYGKIYKLYGCDDVYLNKAKDENINWYNYLIQDGCKQVYKYYDDGGYNIDENIFSIEEENKRFYVGYIGQH